MLGTNSFKKAIEEAEKLSESLKLRLEVSAVMIMVTFLIQTLQNRILILFHLTDLYFLPIFNRYEEVEVRKKLEEKERQEEKKRREEMTEKDGERGSPKTSFANRKDSKKVKV